MQHTARGGKPLTILLPVELSPGGLEAARRQLDEIEALVAGTPRAPKEEGGDADVVTLYKHAGSRNRFHSNTLQLLRIFEAAPSLLTPEEIAVKMGPLDGTARTRGNVRGYWRNLCRTEGRLLKAGKIRRKVLVKDDSRLHEEGASRFGLSPEDRRELQSHLGYRRPARQHPA